MTTENLEPPPPPRRGFRLPAEYYCAPLSEVRPFFPKWVPYGCGAAAAVFLLFLFIGGAMVTGEQVAGLVDMGLGMDLGKLRTQFAADVTEAQKAAFEAEVKRMREDLRSGRISVQRVQPLLSAMEKARADKTVTAEELLRLTEMAGKASPSTR